MSKKVISSGAHPAFCFISTGGFIDGVEANGACSWTMAST